MPPNNNQQSPPGYPQQPQPQNPPQPPAAPSPVGYPAQQGQQPAQPGYGLAQPPLAVQPPTYPTVQPGPAFPAPTPKQQESNPYDFFLEAKQTKGPRGPKSGFKLSKFIWFAVAFFVLLGIAAAVLSANRGGPDPTLSLTTVVQSQQEIIRVSKVGQQKLGSASLKNLAATAETSTITAQQELIAYISKRGGSVDTKALASATNSRTDQALATAEAASTYDTTWRNIMQQMLTDYQVKLQQIQDTTIIESERTIVGKNLASTQLLEQMLGE